jgi:uncharacterized membrane protein
MRIGRAAALPWRCLTSDIGSNGSHRVTEEAKSRHPPEPVDRKTATLHPIVRAGFIEYDRVIFFSDAVFAIAITLLAITLPVSKKDIGSAYELHKAIPSIFGFAISFLVIAFFWIGHHGVFRFIVALDRPLIALNLAFLGMIAFLPYPTRLLSASTASAAVIFYAACSALAGLAQTAIWLYATRSSAGLASPATQPVRNLYLLRMIRVPVVFLLSIPVAIAAPKEAPFVWLLIWVSGAVINRFWPHRHRKPEADQETA